MVITKDDLRLWFDHGKQEGAEYMIVVCDTFSWEDYPVFCLEKDFEHQHAEHDGLNMQKVMEVYDLSIDPEQQIAERRAFHYPQSFAVGITDG